MIRFKTLVITLSLLASNAFAVVDLEITLFNNNEREIRAEKILEKLNQTHDLKLISFTKKIQIKTREIAHSHPVLTLNTRYIDYEVAFFSVFIHEQIHWHLSKPEYKESVERFIVEVRKQYPNIPVGRVGGGARTERSSYLHLAVIFLEFDLLSFYIGQEDAQKWVLKNTIYSSLNRMIIRDYKNFEKLILGLNLHVL